MKIEKELRDIAYHIRHLSQSAGPDRNLLVSLYRRLFSCVDELEQKAHNRPRKPNIGPGAVKRAAAAMKKAAIGRACY